MNTVRIVTHYTYSQVYLTRYTPVCIWSGHSGNDFYCNYRP